MRGERIFITGGAGYIGKHIIKKFYDDNEITVYSRDEAKHYYLKKQFPQVKCVVGDVRNYDLLRRSSVGHDIGIFAASLKQIEAVDQNVEEASRIIIDGAINSRRVSEENGFRSSCFISSDKSRAATTIYGAMKFVAGESFIVNADPSYPRLSCAVYGNVLNSTGSIIPLIWDAIKNGYELTLYSPEMTRFMITADEAVDLIEESLELSGYNLIPDIKSFKVKDLFDIYTKFGLKYNIGVPRVSEKLHEIMIAKEECPRTEKYMDYFRMHYKNLSNNPVNFKSGEFSSADVAVSITELQQILSNFNYFRP